MLTSTILTRRCPVHDHEALAVVSFDLLGVGTITECAPEERQGCLFLDYEEARRHYERTVRDATKQGWKVVYSGPRLGVRENGFSLN
jgi:hypothetical protein